MHHPMYQAAYEFTHGLMDLGLQLGFYWWPFFTMMLIVGILKWVVARAHAPSPRDDDPRDDMSPL